MKISKITFSFFLCNIFLFLSACTVSQRLSTEPPHTAPQRISIEKAEAQVRVALSEWNPDLDPAFAFALEDFTTDEIWDRLHFQIFKLTEPLNGSQDTFVLANGKVDLIGDSFGGWGVTQVFATDLDQDGQFELTYTYSWGSGMHRSHLAMYLPQFDPPQDLEAEQIYMGGDYLITQVNEYTLLVYGIASIKDASNQTLLGRLVLLENAGELQLTLELTE